MIYVSLPLGTMHGWGIAGRMITQELARRTPVQFFSADPVHRQLVEDELELEFLRSLLPPGTDPLKPPAGHAVDGPVLRGIPSINSAACPGLRGPFNVGYTFFEQNLIIASMGRPTFEEFDVIVAGCTWCAEVLRDAGFKNVETILQGIEPRLFNAAMPEKQYMRDRFVIFSGGKLELRKGQDIVIRAVEVMQQRHKDVVLMNAWFNPWTNVANTINASPHIKVPAMSGSHEDVINQLLAVNGIDVSRVVTLGARANPLMARIYRNSDVGLFPNRCEGGTNLVMCEYMACGKPVVASFNTGHKDILSDDNSRPIRKMKTTPVMGDGKPIAEWFEPDLEETIEHLEWAYQNRDELKKLGSRAGEDLAKLTWSKCGEEFLNVLNRSVPSPGTPGEG